MTYEWDTAKAAANLRKHKVSFTEAASVFLDPLALTFDDPTIPWRKTVKSLSESQTKNVLYLSHTVFEMIASE